MRIVVDNYGGPEVLRVAEDVCGEPGEGEVRVRVLAAGVGMPDIMAREGIHPETPATPYTPGWDLAGVIDRLGKGVTGFAPGQRVVAMPIHGAYADYLCLPATELVPLPADLDPAEAVSLVLNYLTAYQMLYRAARVQAGERALVHGASGGVGTALLQLGRLAGLELYGTCSTAQGAAALTALGATPIDYRHEDVIAEIHRLTADGVDLVFDPIGGAHLWHSRQALRRGGRVIGYGTTTTLRREGLDAGRTGRRNRLHGIPVFALYILGGWVLPGRRRIIPYSVQTLKRLHPDWFRQDLTQLLALLQQRRISPLIAQRFPLREARQAHELLASGGVVGKIVLLPDLSSQVQASP